MPASLAVAMSAPADDRDEAVEILIAACRDDPAARALYPTDLEYVRYFPGFVTAFCGRALDRGTVDLDPAGHGAALWFPPGVRPDAGAIRNHLARSLPPARLARLDAGLAMRSRLQPSEPHWYLPWLGVVPEAQGMGVGSALLRDGLARVDADRRPAYLEATTRRSAAFFARHGFEETAVLDVAGHPAVIAMARPAR